MEKNIPDEVPFCKVFLLVRLFFDDALTVLRPEFISPVERTPTRSFWSKDVFLVYKGFVWVVVGGRGLIFREEARSFIFFYLTFVVLFVL